MAAFATAILADTRFTADLETFVARLLEPGRINSLAQTLLKITTPGIPDFYQGTELWNLSLVDPDNRRPSISPTTAACSSSCGPRRRLKRCWSIWI